MRKPLYQLCIHINNDTDVSEIIRPVLDRYDYSCSMEMDAIHLKAYFDKVILCKKSEESDVNWMSAEKIGAWPAVLLYVELSKVIGSDRFCFRNVLTGKFEKSFDIVLAEENENIKQYVQLMREYDPIMKEYRIIKNEYGSSLAKIFLCRHGIDKIADSILPGTHETQYGSYSDFAEDLLAEQREQL